MKNISSEALTNAESRLTGLNSIDPELDFGNNRSIAAMTELTEELRDKLKKYNDAIAALALAKSEIKALEKQVNSVSSEMLKGVAFTFGEDSPQYKQAGGTPISERIQKSRATRLRTAAAKDPSEPRTIKRKKAA